MNPKTVKKKRFPSVCVSCKAQKLKCDRERPQCGRCKRVKRQCSYDYNPPVSVSVQDSILPKTSPSNGSSSNTDNTFSPNILNNIGTLESSVTNEEYKHDFPQAFDEKIEMWEINKQFLSHGYHTYVDLPYATHSISQHDPYLRFFCPSVHGTTLTDLQSRLEYIKDNNNSKSEDVVNSGLLKTVNEVSPLSFIEDAVVKWVAKTNDNVNNQLPWEYFNTIFTIEDRMHPILVATIKRLITEIELLLPNKKKVNGLLKYFYQNIYPFYPLIEIPFFEESIKKMLIDDGVSSSYTILIFQENIRERLECLTLFLIILCITMRSPNLNIEGMVLLQQEFIDIAKKLLVLSQKILSLLNGFKYTSENILCCSLYLLIADIINPGNADEHITHNAILTLKCLSDMADTLGLHEDPSQFLRYFDRAAPPEPFFMYRRKLWIGLQSLRLEIMTADGGCGDSDYEYLERFISDNKSAIPSFVEQFKRSLITDRKIFMLQDDKYQFHILLNRVMCSCGPQCRDLNLNVIAQNIERLKEFTFKKFPLSELQNDSNAEPMKQTDWRDTSDTYFGCYEVMLMAKYVHYLIENELLVKITNDYWKKASETDEIPVKILDMMKLKWGLGPLDTNIISYYTSNPIALAGFNEGLFDIVKDALEQSNVYDNLADIPGNPELSANEQEVLQQLLQSNFELFSSVIGDSLGSLPVL
ncbi:hypothetical protein C6P45_000089 [Maudiozyma exigua]|uniref:Zn(2)-C6 fungal-type domain-containing protein n=1 Tax=Maudiozyma exigua TaxID=34358 RepID=A0A9P7BCP2_MAUEX|nr:hypothetical protein C6P45_000089 [Kazachstania exigua]